MSKTFKSLHLCYFFDNHYAYYIFMLHILQVYLIDFLLILHKFSNLFKLQVIFFNFLSFISIYKENVHQQTSVYILFSYIITIYKTYFTASTTFSTVKPNFSKSFAAGPDAPKPFIETTFPSRPT